MGRKVRVGIIGSQFISTIHAEALRACADAELVAVASDAGPNARARSPSGTASRATSTITGGCSRCPTSTWSSSARRTTCTAR